MIQLRRDLDLAQKPLGPEQRRQIGAEHLDRHLAVVLHVVGEVHRRHAPTAELALDAVAAGERGL